MISELMKSKTALILTLAALFGVFLLFFSITEIDFITLCVFN